jgi:hypothetical protein
MPKYVFKISIMQLTPKPKKIYSILSLKYNKVHNELFILII